MPYATSAIRNETPEPERRLAPVVGIDAGDHRERLRARRDELVEAHADMVRPIAQHVKRSLPPSFELDDLIQVGMIGLLTAAVRYRPQEHGGIPFRMYAKHWVRGAMLDSISGRNWRNGTLEQMPDPTEKPHLELGAAPRLDEAIDARRQLRQAEDAIGYLDERSQRVLEAYYREERPLDEVGEEIGYSRQRTGEFKDLAIERVRRILHVVEK